MSILHADGLVFGKNLWVLWHCTLISVWYGELVSELLKKKKMFFLCILAKNLIIPRMSGLLKFATFCNQFLSSLLPDLDFLQHPAAGPRKSAFNLQKKISIQFFVTYSRAHFFSKVTFYLYQLSNNVSSGLKKVLFSTLKNKKVH